MKFGIRSKMNMLSGQLTSPQSLRPLSHLDAPDPHHVLGKAQCGDMNGTSGARILIVSDDGELRSNVAEYLERQNMSVAGSPGGREEVVPQILKLAPSLVLLHHAPQRNDGLGPLTDIRAQTDVPVIVITGIGTDETDRIVGLELGADDCLTAPFNQRELFARIRAVMRRNASGQEAARRGLTSAVYRFSGWELRQRTRRLTNPRGSDVALSKREFALLIAFVKAPGRLLTREYLVDATHVNSDIFDRSIDVQVHRLRRKLHRDPSTSSMIETERGYGYRFCAPVERVAFK
jgi:two-component system, OmpR family, response regulator